MSSPGYLPPSDLVVKVNGSDHYPGLVFCGCGGATARFTADEPPRLPGQAVSGVTLEAPRLARLPEARRRQLLRECRRVLHPGGRLSVAVGAGEDQYPREALHRAAWACGFEAWVRFAAGRAVLTVPNPRPAEHPLVSILIPAYKSADFAAALDSALAQTWPNCEIIVADDSPDGIIASMVDARRDAVRPGHRIRHHRHRGNVGGRRNYLWLFAEARGTYVKFLNDDDLLAGNCVERMALVLRDHPQVTLATSYRRLIDADGRALPDEPFNQPVLDRDGVIDGRAMATLVLGRMTNLVGEPTTAMFRRADMVDNEPHLMSYAGRSALRNGDMSMWTTLMSRGDVAWLAEPLSSFRQHAGQVQRSERFLSEARRAWAELVQDAHETGLIAPRWADCIAEATTLATDGTDPRELVEQAETAHGADDHATSRRLLKTALLGAPEQARARGDLAAIDWSAGRDEDAVLGAMLALAGGATAETTGANLYDMLMALGRRNEALAVGEAWAVGS